jgi:RimJ/RimL family protein N-acetyltransferase
VAEWNGIELDGLVLHSGRLTLRPWQPSDAPAVEAIMADQRMLQYLNFPNPYTAEAARQFTTEFAPKARETGVELGCALAENATGTVVGAAGLHLSPNTDPEIGYWVAVPHWGNGYATEASQTLARFAFDAGARRVQIRCDVANTGSARVALRAGFRFEGVLRGHVQSGRGWADCAVFGRLHNDAEGAVRPSWPGLTPLTDGVVTVRPMTAEDWPIVLADHNNPEARRWSLSDHVLTEAQARAIAESAPLDWLVRQQARLVICDAATGRGAGSMVLRGFGPPDVVGVGYGVLPEFRGRRFTTRALNLLADWAFTSTSIARLELGCKQGNVASAKAAEAAGFVREGVYAARLRDTDGSYSDEVRFARVRGSAPIKPSGRRADAC